MIIEYFLCVLSKCSILIVILLHIASQKKKIASKYFELNYKRNMLQLSVYDMYEDFVCSTRNILRVEHKLYAFLNRLFCNSAVAAAVEQATDCLNCYFKLNVC